MAGMAVAVASNAPVGLILAISAIAAAVFTPYQPAAGALTREILRHLPVSTRSLILPVTVEIPRIFRITGTAP